MTRDLRIGSLHSLRQIWRVKAKMKRRANSDAEILDRATNALLRAVKQSMLKKEGRVDFQKLREDGYSDRFLARLARA